MWRRTHTVLSVQLAYATEGSFGRVRTRINLGIREENFQVADRMLEDGSPLVHGRLYVLDHELHCGGGEVEVSH